MLLEINNLRVSFFTHVGEIKAVDNISYKLHDGEVIGIVGESGSGKSVSAYAIMRLLQNSGRVIGGSIKFEGEDILKYNLKQINKLRGNKINMIFQNPMTSLNPVYTIGDQITESLLVHDKNIKKNQAYKRAQEILDQVGINNSKKRLKQYPHELSGGMRQRIMIAMALMCETKLLIADEPTTALDVTIQAQILDLLRKIKNKNHMAIIFITHNLGVVADICDKVLVMYAGNIVEHAPVEEIFYNASHPYTQGLLNSLPKSKKLVPIEGTPIDLLDLPTGCNFATRCNSCMKICLKSKPPYVNLNHNHAAACWLLVKNKTN